MYSIILIILVSSDTLVLMLSIFGSMHPPLVAKARCTSRCSDCRHTAGRLSGGAPHNAFYVFIHLLIHSFIHLRCAHPKCCAHAGQVNRRSCPEFSQAAQNDAGKISSGATTFVYLSNDADSLSRAADSPRTAEPCFSTFVSRFHSRLRPRDKLSKRVCSRPSVRRRYVTPAVKVSSRFWRRRRRMRLISCSAITSHLCRAFYFLFIFFASSCVLPHPSMCSQCHFSPRDTLCPPQSNGGAPCGSPRQTLCFKPARPITFTARVLASILVLLFTPFLSPKKKASVARTQG